MLTALINVSAPHRKVLEDAGQPVPDAVAVRALVDTGASCTCIDPSALASLAITPTGSVPIHTPSTGAGAATMDQYDVSIVILGSSTSAPPLYLPVIPVVASALQAQGIQALIGRDILQQCVLVYNGSQGFFTLAF